MDERVLLGADFGRSRTAGGCSQGLTLLAVESMPRTGHLDRWNVDTRMLPGDWAAYDAGH
jgi:hypothetical protein